MGAYDPNDKIVLPGNYTTVDLAAGTPLMYTVRFQNTGTYPASFVRIEDTLSARLDRATFRIEQSSHPVRYELQDGGVVTFHFPGIVLPSTGEDEAGSQGFVRYSVRPESGIQIGDSIPNTAHIYFDFNLAVVTNTTQSVLQEIVAAWEKLEVKHLRLFPNPASANLNWDINGIEATGTARACIYDLQGRSVLQINDLQAGKPLNVGHLPAGTYVLCIRGKQGWYAGKWKKI